MLFSAQTLMGDLSMSNAPTHTWKWQPTIDYHEEGRPLQFLDTPATPATVPLFVYHARFHNKSL